MPKAPTPWVERFWLKVDRSAGVDACHPWTGPLSHDGYGRACKDRVAGRNPQVYAHRAAFELAYGPIPEGHDVDHTCHNAAGCELGDACPHRRCCNPRHLRAVDHRTNMLAGQTFAAKQARRTHCPKGHAYIEGNIYWDGRKRKCRACTLNRMRRAA